MGHVSIRSPVVENPVSLHFLFRTEVRVELAYRELVFFEKVRFKSLRTVTRVADFHPPRRSGVFDSLVIRVRSVARVETGTSSRSVFPRRYFLNGLGGRYPVIVNPERSISGIPVPSHPGDVHLFLVREHLSSAEIVVPPPRTWVRTPSEVERNDVVRPYRVEVDVGERVELGIPPLNFGLTVSETETPRIDERSRFVVEPERVGLVPEVVVVLVETSVVPEVVPVRTGKPPFGTPPVRP